MTIRLTMTNRRPSWKRLVALWLLASVALVAVSAGFTSAIGVSAGDGAIVGSLGAPLILGWAIFFARRSSRRLNL
jgi:uncharacterized BrkB/YihY/UPF0761 family membrane protein